MRWSCSAGRGWICRSYGSSRRGRRGAAVGGEHVRDHGDDGARHVQGAGRRRARREVRSPIGRALPHLSVRVLDADRRPVAVGSVGEMWVAGAGVSSGYLGGRS
ncbi:AMP-binding protein [Streptomyces sp. LBUM 1476]|nr:AMP-binding protein [Streptomyces sp. LBUM 1476]